MGAVEATDGSERVAAVIPARYGSTRLPGKPLLSDTGKPLIQHVYEQVSLTPGLAEVIVATDDERIVRAVKAFGGRAALTSPDHSCGTERVAEVARGLPAGIVLNVQGDEPEVSPEDLGTLVGLMLAEKSAGMGTLVFPSQDERDYRDPNVVKAVVDREGYALYFSRSNVPFHRDGSTGNPTFFKHLGIYVYRSDFLQTFTQLAPTPLEQAEKLEQLRALEHGYRIRVGIATRDSTGIDTPEDYEAFVRLKGRIVKPDNGSGGD